MTDYQTKALFLACDPIEARNCWIGIVAHSLFTAGSAVWIGLHLALADVWLWPALFAGLLLADLYSGFVHWLFDTWFDEIWCERLISIAREHHLFPQHIIGYGFRDYVSFSSWPTVLVFGPVGLVVMALEPTAATFDAMAVCLLVSVVMFFGTYAHRLGHKRADTAFGRFLQDHHLLMSPRHHRVHHGGNHDIRYCVVTGWTNHICDRIGFWRGLEALVTRLTGAVPRRNDHEWFARFDRDPTFLAAARR